MLDHLTSTISPQSWNEPKLALRLAPSPHFVDKEAILMDFVPIQRMRWAKPAVFSHPGAEKR